MIVLDMDAPKSCTYCPCATEDFGETRCVLGSPDIDWNERPCTCPMIKADGLISREEVLRYISRISVPENCVTGEKYEERLCGKESCEDAVKREAVLNTLDTMDKALDEDRTVEHYKELLAECYKALPSVTPTPTECEDAVSRQAVLKLTRAERIFPHLTDDLMSSIKNVIFASDVKTLPPVAPKQRWIPVSERLPEVDGEYLATIYDMDEGYKYMDIAELENGIWQYKNYIKVLAWMPLPEPYKEGESE